MPVNIDDVIFCKISTSVSTKDMHSPISKKILNNTKSVNIHDNVILHEILKKLNGENTPNSFKIFTEDFGKYDIDFILYHNNTYELFQSIMHFTGSKLIDSFIRKVIILVKGKGQNKGKSHSVSKAKAHSKAFEIDSNEDFPEL